MPRLTVAIQLARLMLPTFSATAQDAVRRRKELWESASRSERCLAQLLVLLLVSAILAAVAATVGVYGYLLARRFIH